MSGSLPIESDSGELAYLGKDENVQDPNHETQSEIVLPACGASSSDNSSASRSSIMDDADKHHFMDIDQEKLIELLVTDDDMDVPIVPILITAAGLPNSHKTTTVDEFFKQYRLSHTKAHVYPPLEHAGIKWYELVAMWNKQPTSGLLSQYTCYLYAMYCGLSQKYQSKKQEIRFQPEDESTPKSLVFPDDKLLEGGLDNIFQELQEFHTSDDGDKKRLIRENFQRVLPKGVAFMNIWNIKLSKAVFYFLPLLSGQLSHDYLWLFFDLERDTESMHLPPEVPATYFDHDVLMIWRSRLYYMLRHVYFTTGSNTTGESRCLMLPVCNKMSTTSDHLLEQCKKQMIDLAREMKIEHLIDLEKEMHILSLDTSLSDRNGQLRNKADELLTKGFKSPTTVPLSHIFLRNCLYISDSLYIEKEVLQNKAKKLEMDDDSFNKFCKFFNSGGSIIDASLLGSQSPYIITKPIHFFSKLDQIFNYNESELVTLFGLFSLSVAKKLLDINTKFFMDVLSSAGLGIELSYEQILLPSDFQEVATPPLYYIPIAGRKHSRKDCKPTALHLQITGQVLNRNIQVAFTKEFLNLNSTAKLNFKSPASREMNCSSFDFQGTQFDIVCHGNEAEFILPDTCTNEAIYEAIADSCYNVLTQLINSDVFFCFGFSFICCQKEKVTEFKFDRERHHLPYSVAGSCDECDELMSTQKTMKIWNKYMEDSKWKRMLENDRYKIEFKNAEMSLHLMEKFADSLGELSEESVKMLALSMKFEKGLDEPPLKGYKGGRRILIMILEYEKRFGSSMDGKIFYYLRRKLTNLKKSLKPSENPEANKDKKIIDNTLEITTRVCLELGHIVLDSDHQRVQVLCTVI